MVLQHRCHLIKRCIFLVKSYVRLLPPHLAQQPFANFETTVFIVLLVLVGLFQKQDADCETENNNEGAYKVRQKKWE